MLRRLLILMILIGVMPVSPVLAGHGGTKPLVHFGVRLQGTPLATYRRYQPLMDYLTLHTPYHFDLKIGRNHQENVTLLKGGKIRFAILGDLAFVQANLRFGAVPIAKVLNEEGRPFVRSALIVSMNSPIKSLREVRGRSFAFGHLQSTPGNLAPRYLLRKNGIVLGDLGRHANLKNHEEVVRGVIAGQWDVGAVSDAVAKKYQPQGVRVLAYSGYLPSPPIVTRPDTRPELVRSVTAALLKLDSTSKERARHLDVWDSGIIFGFTTAKTSDYSEIFQMFRTTDSGCGMGCHT